VDKTVPIVVPRETVSDDTVRIVRWMVVEGQPVTAGMLVLEIETSKAAVDVEAPASGYAQILRQAGDVVEVGSEVGRITECQASTPVVIPDSRTEPPVVAGGPLISGDAQRLMDERGVRASDLGLDVIRASDVLAWLQRQSAPPVEPQASTPAPAPEPERRSWWSEARAASADRGIGVGGLVVNYLFRNYLLGLAVRVAPVNATVWIHRRRGVRIGRDCFIDPSATLETAYPEHITIGDDVRVTVNAIIMTHVKAPHALRESGRMPRVVRPVVLEDHCFIGVGAIILPGVTVGARAVVASGAVVMANVPPDTMVMGNPAKVVKMYDPA
jgi:acetyltransferase-like isoleucine patch superfamily enzyme